MNHKEKENYKNIRDWIKPIQKSLTLESESQFINILGREKLFNEYLYESFKKIDKLEFHKDNLLKIEQFRQKYLEYNKLEISQRRRLVIDTRKFLYKISKTINQNLVLVESSKIIKSEQKFSNLSLLSEVSEIKGVGNVLKENLNQLGLFIVKDLLEYFPKTYLDYSNKEKIINLRPDNLYTCTGTIKKFFIYKSKKNINMSIMNIVIFDETSSIKITKFLLGKRYRSYSFVASLKDKYKPGIKLAVFGKVKSTDYGRSFVDPQIEILNTNENAINYSGKILPIYYLNDSISNISFIKIIKNIIYCSSRYPEILSNEQLSSLSLLSIHETLSNIHIPQNQVALDEAKKRLVFDELLYLQLKFLLRRNQRNQNILRSNIVPHNPLFDDFLQKIPFKLTKSQEKVLDEIKSDLISSKPMARLLQGDVGSGKTIIAIASLVFIIEHGYQGALMVPTEVLAEQHFKNLLKNLNSILISVEILTGNTSQKKRKEILSNLENGQINILVGTHALFEEKVIFNKLGLVVIDEQHRFGVNQRNRLLRKGENCHLLSMTATPIPRTLALSIYGDLDISKITELPPGRVPIKTEIIFEEDLLDLFEVIKLELKKGKQAYVILPLIEESEKLNLNSAKNTYKYLSDTIFDQFNIGLLHGKLNAEEKNNVIEMFLKKDFQILVSTTVIEVGIDVPNASIMIIYNSERFGLSQLHQLRGRVGRDSYQSYCYLVTSEKNSNSKKRLNVLQKSSDGFYIAEKDLELRGPGQILGYKQSGLPDFVLNNLPKNKILIDKAREEAIKILKNDPKLDANLILKNIIYNNSSNKFIHDFLN